MTMIGFATYGDHAEFMTDSVSYAKGGNSLGQCTKSVVLPHMDAACLTQGDSMFGNDVKTGALQVSGNVSTFDELLETAPKWLAQLWRDVVAEQGEETTVDSVAFLLGWSDIEQEFVAYTFASEQGFKPQQVKRTWAMPCPWTHRPSAVEFRRIKDSEADHPHIDQMMDTWSRKPYRPRPESVEDWVQLAKDVREQRAQGGFGRVYVAGDVFHTRLGRGEITTRRVHRYDDSGEEFQRMIEWSHHPQAQAAACHCGSGETFRDCHLTAWYAETGATCVCGSGDPFPGCCKVGAAQVTAASRDREGPVHTFSP